MLRYEENFHDQKYDFFFLGGVEAGISFSWTSTSSTHRQDSLKASCVSSPKKNHSMTEDVAEVLEMFLVFFIIAVGEFNRRR